MHYLGDGAEGRWEPGHRVQLGRVGQRHQGPGQVAGLAPDVLLPQVAEPPVVRRELNIFGTCFWVETLAQRELPVRHQPKVGPVGVNLEGPGVGIELRRGREKT